MSEMIERVAKAILKRRFYDCEPDMYGNDIDLFFKQVDPDHVMDAHDEARAAIEAMREPTEDMSESAYARLDWGPPGYEDAPGGASTPERAWQAMIDQALNDKPVTRQGR